MPNINQIRNQNKTISNSPPTVKTHLENIQANTNTNQIKPQNTMTTEQNINVNLTRVKYQVKQTNS